MRNPPVKLLDRVRQRIRLKGYSIRTEKTYVSWIRQFILFHGKQHPRNMGKPEIEAFLSHLVACEWGSGHAILLIFMDYRSKNRCFLLLTRYFQG